MDVSRWWESGQRENTAKGYMTSLDVRESAWRTDYGLSVFLKFCVAGFVWQITEGSLGEVSVPV